MTHNNLCSTCKNIGCEFQSGIVRTKCAFYVPPHIESDNCGNYVVMSSVRPQEPCDDVISREWLKTAIHNFYYGLKHIPSEEDIQAYIDAAPSVTQKSGKWIPFSEKLPKPFEHCLITTTDGEVIYHYDDGHYSKYKAWMPLPKPYEPQESEEQTE